MANIFPGRMFRATFTFAGHTVVVTGPHADTIAGQISDPAPGIAGRKLDQLLTEGFRINGLAIRRDGNSPQQGFVTDHGMVGWWNPGVGNSGVELVQERSPDPCGLCHAPLRDDIIRMAQEAGIVTGENLRFSEGYRYRSVGAPTNVREDCLVQFAGIVAAATRAEEAAKRHLGETPGERNGRTQ